MSLTTPPNATVFASRLELPISWETLGGAPTDQEREAAEQANGSLLAFLLQEIELEARPRPTDEQLMEALAPLSAKLDVVVGLLTRLSYRDTERAPRRLIELDERHIAWRSPSAISLQQWLRLRIYFHPTFLEPVVLFAQVTDVTATDGNFRIEASLADSSERVASDLLRLALLTQRRQRAARLA